MHVAQRRQYWVQSLKHSWHAGQCAINYDGSSSAMDVEAARRLWSHSEAQHQLRYTSFLRDGDSKAYKAVTELELYPELIVKKECINHTHKRMGDSTY